MCRENITDILNHKVLCNSSDIGDVSYACPSVQMCCGMGPLESGKKYVAIFDKSRYGGHFEDGTLYLSLVRGTTYCAHPIEDRMLIPDDRYTKKMDQGEHNYFFRLSVCDEIELDRKANEFNRKPYAVNVFPLGELDGVNKFDVSVSN